MNIRYFFNATAAASAVVTMMLASPAQVNAAAQAPQADQQPETPITVIGCIQKESDYRREHDSGRGGAVATGIGQGDEFILVNATQTQPGSSAAGADASCAGSSGEAYPLTGDKEDDLKQLVGRRVEITGVLKKAKVEAVGTAGAADAPEPTGTTGTAGAAGTRPTGGIDPFGNDLKLFEIEVSGYREVGAAAAAAAAPSTSADVAAQSTPSPAVTATAPPPQAQATPAPAAPSSQTQSPPSAPAAAPSARAELPRTGSPVPAVGLMGLLSLVGALVVHSLRR